MQIHPIDFRYGTPEMKTVWSEENRFCCVVSAETALVSALASCGIIPEADANAVSSHAHEATLARAKEIEAEIGHDLMGMVKALSEVCGEAGRYVHFGATSSDILDTATGLQLKQALDILDAKLEGFLAVLLERAEETKHLVCIARTHGQHALPMTYGLRFAVWAEEIARHRLRISEIRPRAAVGKLTGAVGTLASLGKDGLRVQAEMMRRLGLSDAGLTTQVIARDRYAEYIFLLANIASTLEKIAVAVRSLQRTEIGEVSEPFGKNQVGSSTMPHKRNPVKCEQVCGLSRIIRGMVEPALLNNTLWDERDLTNSASERITFPEASVLTDHCLKVMTAVISGLEIHEDAVKRNLDLLQGVNLAESVMLELTRRGMPRQDAHEIIRRASLQALDERRPLAEILSAVPAAAELLPAEEIAGFFTAESYLGLSVEQTESLIQRLRG
ncbi:MAG: adenylosuccinate lyase [Methanocorpusculaceae archaeon]|nr:adenylosuccinate lyase [Methanocorpusculaceae archaeon]